jgi:hypothetical protein
MLGSEVIAALSYHQKLDVLNLILELLDQERIAAPDYRRRCEAMFATVYAAAA